MAVLPLEDYLTFFLLYYGLMEFFNFLWKIYFVENFFNWFMFFLLT